MKRTIKFRGKGYNNKWYFGSLLTDRDGNTYIMLPTDISYNCGLIDEAPMFPVIPETVGQFVGLHDHNGAEIFEDDIIVWGNDDDPDFPVPFEASGSNPYLLVRYVGAHLTIDEPDTFNYMDFELDADYAAAHYKVVGNIHDNPELLKGGEI